MKILYFDTPMGISGDMCLGALIDMGVDAKMLLSELKKLHADEIDVRISKEVRHSITATSFRVRLAHSHGHRTFADIKRLINQSRLAKDVKELSIAIFKNIAVAEGRVHGISAEKVHFHEVGAMDSIIDIVGAAIAIKSLNVDAVFSSPVPLGAGFARTMHGVIPIPAPATVEILKGVPIMESAVPFELTTPTGAAILKTLSAGFGPMPSMVIEKTGYGAGKKDFKDAANLLRVIVGRSYGGAALIGGGGSIIIETNIDDMSPELFGYLMERLLAAGALDVFFTPVQMKKSRPGALLTVLTDEASRERLLQIIFSESTSIGVRMHPVERVCLERKIIKVKTRYGGIGMKVSVYDGKEVSAEPEYEECRELAAKLKMPLKAVMNAARVAYSGRK